MKIWIFTNGWRLLIVTASVLVITLFPAITGVQAEADLPDMGLIEFLGDLDAKGEDGFELLQFIDSTSTGGSSQDTKGEVCDEIDDKTMQGKTNDK